jgi:hypothetical protein
VSLALRPILSLCFIAAGISIVGCKSNNRSHPFADVAARDADKPPHEQVQTEDALATGQTRLEDPEARKEARKAAEASAQQQAHVIAQPPPPPQQIPTGPRRPRLAATTYPSSAIRVEPDGSVVRLWPEATSWRPSGDVLAGPTYYAITKKASTRPEWVTGWLEFGGFLLDTALVPVNAVITPPWTPIAYSASDDTQSEETTARKLRNPWHRLRWWKKDAPRPDPATADVTETAATQTSTAP